MMETAIQCALPLFDDLSFGALLTRRKAADRLSVTINQRLKRGWQVKIRPLSGKRQLIIPAILDDAPGTVKNALIEWALLPLRPRRPRKKAWLLEKKELERVIWRHFESLAGAHYRTPRFDPTRIAGNTHGRVYDLREVFDTVNFASFNGGLSSLLCWGPPLSKTSHHTIKTDQSGNRINLITIAGIYNHPEVPRFAIEAIMHHEMLHIALPPFTKNGRRVIHGLSFKNAERSFLNYREWRAWERDCLPSLLRRNRR
jgi:hypothetical protein